MTEPVRVGEVLPEVVAEAIARAGPGYDRWLELVTQTGYCPHPVRLRAGSSTPTPQTGEVRTVYSTGREPDATLLKACGNRRTSICPTCSATYQADSFQLLAAGLRGGKGVPETVARHPRLFVTFTAPSFGHVHTRKAQGLLVFPCHPYRQGQKCPHGRRAAVVADPPSTCTAPGPARWADRGRAVAARADLVRQGGRVPEAGAVHFHAIIRLDAATDCGARG